MLSCMVINFVACVSSLYKLNIWYFFKEWFFIAVTLMSVNYIVFLASNSPEALKRLGRILVISTSIASVYGLVTSSFAALDINYQIFESFNSAGEYSTRVRGASMEASVFCVFVFWVILIQLNIHKKERGKLVVNLIAWFLTISTMIGMQLAIFLFLAKKHIYTFMLFIGFLFIVLSVLETADSEDNIYLSRIKAIEYQILNKYSEISVNALNQLPDSSGSMRSLTTILGFDIFLSNPFIGVGAGQSSAYLYQAADSLSFSSTENEHSNYVRVNTPIHNGFVKGLSEFGIFQFTILICYIAYCSVRLKIFQWRCYVYWLIFLVEFLVIYPLYSPIFVLPFFLFMSLHVSSINSHQSARVVAK